LGAFNTDTAKAAFNPRKYRRILVVNPTTNGWEYLATNPESGPDYKGFLDASSAYNAGLSSSIPFTNVVWETDLGYTHLGTGYLSQGNPFLGGNPGNGWNLQQRLGFLDNRLHFGLEGTRYLQEFGDYSQLERGGKAEAKYMTESQQSTAWINGGASRQSPQGDAPYRYRQDFNELNMGGSGQLPSRHGTLSVFSQYGYTYGMFKILDSDPETPVYPASRTHAVSTSFSFRFRDSDLLAKSSHTYSDNGVQKPVNSVTLGMQDSYFDRVLRFDGNVLVAEYAKTRTRNDIGYGQNATATWRFTKRHLVKATEKWSKYGDRVILIAGGNYEMTF
jgi:hypothetical protein